MPSSTSSSRPRSRSRSTNKSGKKIDRYSMIKVIGKGTFGKAILVEEKATQKRYIMKQINISTLSRKERKEAINEVKVLSALRNDFIVSYVTSFMSDGRLCIIMQYASNGDLYQKIKQQRGRPFDESQVLKWFVQLCLAVKHCHDRRILHRDLKTQNIFLDKYDNVQLGDFGISKVLQSTMECARTMVGTPYYLSPELCREEPYNNKSDIWSLGCILYELCTGKHAFEGINMKALVGKILRGIYPPISSRYSRDLRALIDKMLQKSPRRRPSVNSILKLPFIRDQVRKMVDRKTYEKVYNISSESSKKSSDDATARSKHAAEGDKKPHHHNQLVSEHASKPQRARHAHEPVAKENKRPEEHNKPSATPRDYVMPLSKPVPTRVQHVDLHADILSKYKMKQEKASVPKSDEHASNPTPAAKPKIRNDLKEKFKIYEDKKRALLEKFAARKNSNDDHCPLKHFKKPEASKEYAVRAPHRHQNLVLNQILNNDQNRPAAVNALKNITEEKKRHVVEQHCNLKVKAAWSEKADKENIPAEPRKQEKPHARPSLKKDMKPVSATSGEDETRAARLKRLNELQARRRALEERERLLNNQKNLLLVEKKQKKEPNVSSPSNQESSSNKPRAKPALTKTIRQSVQKFKLNGATLRKGGVNDPTSSLCYRIEALRMHLESELGEETLYKVYNLVKSCDECEAQDVDKEIAIEREIESILGHDRLCFLSLIHQLMFCEDAFHQEQ